MIQASWRIRFISVWGFEVRLKQSFEPHHTKFRARDELLDLKHGKRGIHAYAQRARCLVSCIVLSLINEHTQVTVFIKGLADNPVKTDQFHWAIRVAGSSDICSGAWELQPTKGSYLLGFGLSTKMTGERKSTTNGHRVCSEKATSRFRIQSIAKEQSLSENRLLCNGVPSDYTDIV